MNTPPANRVRVACRQCGMVMTARREHLGRRAECKRCREVIELVEAPALEHPSGLPAPKPAPKPQPATTANVSCRVCGTRMAFALEHVGREAKCPDCGARTVIPPPPPPKKPKAPPAMEGEQYEVWQGDAQPWGVDLARNRPQVLRVSCRVCQTMMDAAPEQVGEWLTCPDCGVETVVKPPQQTKSAPRPDVHKIASYQVSAARAVEAPPQASAWLESLQRSGGGVNEFAPPPRPKLPRWPMTTRVMRFVRSPGFVGRWLGLSGGLCVSAVLLGVAFVQFATAATAGGSAAAGYVMIGAAAALLAALAGFATLNVGAALAMTILTETSDGNDHIQQWPTHNLIDGFGDLLMIAAAGMISATPGWLLAAPLVAYAAPPAGLGPLAYFLATALSGAVFFPIVLLSQLAESSFAAIVSYDVLTALRRAPLAWFVLVVESVLLAAAVLAALLTTAALPPLIVVTAPLLVLLAGVYARLVGRLGWVVAERAVPPGA